MAVSGYNLGTTCEVALVMLCGATRQYGPEGTGGIGNGYFNRKHEAVTYHNERYFDADGRCVRQGRYLVVSAGSVSSGVITPSMGTPQGEKVDLRVGDKPEFLVYIENGGTGAGTVVILAL